MFCENCGKQLPEGSQFCDACGAKTADQQSGQEQASPNYQQQPYAPPAYQQNQYGNNGYQNYPPQQGGKVAPVMSVGAFLGTMILLMIPLVNIILLFVWAFGSGTNPNKKNYCRATLIMILIGIVISILFSTLLVGLFANIFNQIGGEFYY